MNALLVLSALYHLASPHADASMGDKVDQFLAPIARANEFSGVVLVRKDGKVLLRKPFGSAYREFAVPNGSDTKFLIGSISKQFTAAAVLLLASEGKLRLEDHLSRFVPQFPSAELITIRQMLSHRSGISRDLPDDVLMSPHTTREMVDIIAKMPLVFAPGTDEAYSNNAYRVLAYIIEQCSGDGYGEFITDHFFKPLKMNDSGDLDGVAVVKGLATGYVPGFSKDGLDHPTFADISNGRGPGSIYSTVDDLAKWAEDFIRDGKLYPGIRDEMIKGDLGVITERKHGKDVVWHNGEYRGFTSFVEEYPNDRVTIVYLGNIETFASLTPVQTAIDSIVMGDRYEPFVPRPRGGPTEGPDADGYVGTYTFSPTLSIQVAKVGGWLAISANPLERVSGDQYFFRLKYADVLFKRDGAGKVVGMDWREAGHTYPAKKT